MLVSLLRPLLTHGRSDVGRRWPMGTLKPQAVVTCVSPGVAGHVAVAISTHRDRLRTSGHYLPEPELTAVQDVFQRAATSCQDTTILDRLDGLRNASPMAKALTLQQVSQVLAVSTRTVERLIDDGLLLAVRIGSRSVRVRVVDLDRYLAVLPTTGGRTA